MKEEIVVHTQKEFDDIKQDFDGLIIIKDTDKEIVITPRNKATIEIGGSSHATVKGTAYVKAIDEAYVKAFDSATIEAFNKANIIAAGTSIVIAFGYANIIALNKSYVLATSAVQVKAFDMTFVTASGESYIKAFDCAVVKAIMPAHVEAYGSSNVQAFDKAYVEAHGTSIVKAYRLANVKGFDNAVIFYYEDAVIELHDNATSKQLSNIGYTKNDLLSIAEHVNDKIVLYKSVNCDTFCDFYTGKIKYEIGKEVECPDWDSNEIFQCGNGLHLSIFPFTAQIYNEGTILRCLVDPDDVVVFPDDITKVRCRKVLPIAIVDKRGNIISENNRNEVHKN